MGLKITNFQSKHVALLKNKKDCVDVYCVTLIELQAHRDAFIQNKEDKADVPNFVKQFVAERPPKLAKI